MARGQRRRPSDVQAGNTGSRNSGVNKSRATKPSAVLRDDLGQPQPHAVDYSFYADPAYWDARYSAGSRGAGHYEWFDAGPEDLLPLLRRFVRRSDVVLEVGCGTSGLLKALLDDGHQGDLIGVDCAPAAIAWAEEHLGGKTRRTAGSGKSKAGSASSEPAGEQHAGVRGVKYMVADAQDLSQMLDQGSVDVVLEKGTLAGLFSAEGGQVGTSVLAEISRLLRKDGGTLVSVSPHDPFDENEGRNGLNVLEELVFPPLAEAPASAGTAWSCEVHTAEGSKVHVYALRRRRRPATRAALADPSPQLDVTMHTHGE